MLKARPRAALRHSTRGRRRCGGLRANPPARDSHRGDACPSQAPWQSDASCFLRQGVRGVGCAHITSIEEIDARRFRCQPERAQRPQDARGVVPPRTHLGHHCPPISFANLRLRGAAPMARSPSADSRTSPASSLSWPARTEVIRRQSHSKTQGSTSVATSDGHRQVGLGRRAWLRLGCVAMQRFAALCNSDCRNP